MQCYSKEHAGAVLVHPQLGQPLPCWSPAVKSAAKLLAGGCQLRKEKLASELLHADSPGEDQPPSCWSCCGERPRIHCG